MVFSRVARFINVLVTFFLFIDFGHAQQKQFKGLPVDTVEISSSSGYYHFDDSGTTTGIRDSYLIAFDKKHEKYFTQYKRIGIKLTIHPEAEENKQQCLRTGSLDKQAPLDSLFNSLSVRYRALSVDQLGFSKEEAIKIITKKRIRRVAKSYRQDWHFKRKYSTKSENEQIFRGCRNTDTFTLFLDSFKVDTNVYVMVSDYWDEMHIRIVCGDKTFSFEGKYPNKLKQPWYFRSDSVFVGAIFNFDINKYLIAILPSGFYRKNRIDTEALLNNYIFWYLKRRDIISGYN